MDKKVAILRGINVGGKRKILMQDLRCLFEKLDFTDIVTYIQSGNVLFKSPSKLSEIDISTKVKEAISNKYNFDVPVIIRSIEELKQTVSRNPFTIEKETDINQLHLTFLNETPSPEYIKNADSYNSGADKFVIDTRNVYVSCAGKYHQSKLTNIFFERKLKVTATTRNWKTVLKIIELGK